MKLYELPDKDFDERFREAADYAGYPFKKDAWSSLEKKLKGRGKFGLTFWKLSGGLFSVLLVALLFLFFSDRGLRKAEIPAGLNAERGGISVDKSGESGIFFDDDHAGIPSTVRKEQGNSRYEEATQNEDEIDEEGSDLREPAADGTLPMDDPRRKFTVLRPYTGKEQNGNLIVPGVADAEIRSENVSAGIYGPESASFQHKAVRDPGFTALQNPSGFDSGLKGIYGVSEVIPDDKKNTAFGYSVNAMVGPDFSGVGAGGYGTGTYAGIGLEFYIGKRFSLMTGVSHARKKYAVQDEYSVPYPGNYSYNMTPDRVDIACHVLDIPVNVYYTILSNGRNRLFAGAGMSTYLMLTEEYHFNYDGYQYQDPVTDYTVKNENQHYFGIVNLSAGYSRNINERFAWQVEPYLKLPIEDIAAARVRLNSFGAVISLKYRLR